MEKVSDFLKCAACPFLQWDRLRHPYAGWLRVALGLLFPFIVWSHDWLLISLLVVAVFSHPYWFPAYTGSEDKPHFFTKLVDAWKAWLEKTPREEKIFFYFPGIVLVLPLLCFLWKNDFIWSLYFFAAAAGYKVLFARKLLNSQ